MRSLGEGAHVHLNPNDGMAGGFAQKKRQYLEANMHYITHNAVIPPVDGKVWLQ